MDTIKIKGMVKRITDLTERNEKFKKRDCIVKTEGEYSQIFCVEFVNDNEEKLDLIDVGDTVEIEANLRGREWTNPEGEVKYFTSITGWKIKKV